MFALLVLLDVREKRLFAMISSAYTSNISNICFTSTSGYNIKKRIFTIIISASPLWWWVSTKRIGRAMIVIVIRPTLRCVFRVVCRCDHSNSAGNRLCPRGILLRRARRWCRHRHIGTLQVIPFTLKL